MHETAVAQGLIEAILQEADKQGGRPVRAKMSCGRLNAVNDEVLRFAFEAIAEGTPCEGMALEIEHKPLQAKCRACESAFAIDLSDARCPRCAGDDFELLPDAPLVLDEIEFEKE
ncbi:hydrogenase maturation nickel metallochaperone HypA [Anaerobaca lacustris]|uniref:Hydrogenase maturation factor HypA n=1 Tax=Anaerobaca lacustris TaxID=3044600 RepID=A0AAW6TXR6_9BACT|nr:hydrogenase maturation nickel metallochaperone HypA [Sedimentisphaerales bacterium M17dextr]